MARLVNTEGAASLTRVVPARGGRPRDQVCVTARRITAADMGTSTAMVPTTILLSSGHQCAVLVDSFRNGGSNLPLLVVVCHSAEVRTDNEVLLFKEPPEQLVVRKQTPLLSLLPIVSL